MANKSRTSSRSVCARTRLRRTKRPCQPRWRTTLALSCGTAAARHPRNGNVYANEGWRNGQRRATGRGKRRGGRTAFRVRSYNRTAMRGTTLGEREKAGKKAPQGLLAIESAN